MSFYLFIEHLDSNDHNTTGRSTPTLCAPKKESSGAPYRSTRFGFRKSNIVRPASTGIPKVTNFDNTANNNNNNTNASGMQHISMSSQVFVFFSVRTNNQRNKIQICANLI